MPIGQGLNHSSLRCDPTIETTDEVLMDRITHGDQQALEILLKRHGAVLANVINSVIHDETETQDVLMEVFLHSWNVAAQYSPDKGKPLGWLVMMAKRRGIDRLRKRQRYAAATARLQLETERTTSAVTLRASNRQVEWADFQHQLQSKINELPVLQRDAIHYAFFKGMSQREISAETGIPLGTVKTRIELGLKKLAIKLGV